MTGFIAYALHVDGQAHAQGVVAAPTFSWRLASSGRGDRQVSYRIVVEMRMVDGSRARVWDSGVVASSSSTGVRYNGGPLLSSADYVWGLSVTNQAGTVAVAEGEFATAIIHADEWVAQWIGRDPVHGQTALPPQDTDITYTVNKLQPVRRYARHFELTDVPARAKVHASAKGIYRLYVNGRRVGTDELAPGWTEYKDRITYQSWDITDLLRQGRNSIAALVGDGWYVGFIGTDRRQQAQHYGREPELLVQLVSDGRDGSRTVLGTDETWRELPSDILYADLLMGQYEDSRKQQPDWHLPECDLSGWRRPLERGGDVSLLTPEVDPGVRATRRLPGLAVTRSSAGGQIVDFGQNLVGRVKLRLRNQPAGTRIELNHAEVLEDGDLYTANLRTAEPVDVFWTNGEPEQEFEPRFTLHGFRYVEVRGLVGDLLVEDVEAVVLHNDFEFVGRFESSSADLNQLHSNIGWGLRGNFVSIPTDCPQRDERLGWLADAQVFTPTALSIADVTPLLRRWLRDVRSAQKDGAFPDIAPQLIHYREGAPAWGDGGVTIPWELYRASGEVAILEEAADSMLAWVRHLERHNPDLVWRQRVGNNYGDWLQIGEETRRDVLATAYFARSADLTARTLEILGRAEEASDVAGLASRIREVYRREFIAADGTVAGDTQGGYLLTLAFDLCSDDEQRDLVAGRLVEAVERRDVSLTTGFVTVGLLCPELARIGREDLAFRLLHNDRFPSWLFSIRNGATTIWERWDGWTQEAGFQSPRMNSFNHYSLGSVGQWFTSGILGIGQTPSSAAWSEAHLEPRFDPFLEWAAGSLETPRGRFASRWERIDGFLRWEVEIPPGPSATAILPCASHLIQEGGESSTQTTGVTLIEEDPGSVRLGLQPGRYDFRFPTG